MDEITMKALAFGAGYAAVGLAAIGSAIGTGMAGITAIGAWKKCYQQGKAAPFLLLAMVGAPLSQTIYAMIMMIILKGRIEAAPQYSLVYIILGLLGGLAQMASAFFQGKCAASGCVSFAETGKGFANYLMVIGVVETCAIFSLIFSFMAMP